MSRKLLIGPIEYAWPNDGDLDWGQDVFDWAEAISKVATENVQSRVPSGGDGGQILAKSGDADYALHWINPPTGGGGSGGGTTYTAGSGLTLSAANQFRIMDGTDANQILVFDGSAWTLEAKPSGSSGVEDLSGVKGGSGITVTHTESNTVATVAVTNSIQTALVPTGGSAGQVLTKRTGEDHELEWTTVSSGGTTYRAGVGLTLTSNTFSIGTDQIINSMMQDDSIEQSNIWATANATDGQVLTAHSDGTRFVWKDLPTGGGGSGYEGPADMDVITLTSQTLLQLTEDDHLNKIIAVQNNFPNSDTPLQLRLPDTNTLSTTAPRFFCRIYITDNKNPVTLRPRTGTQLEVSNPNGGPFGRVSVPIYLGSSRNTSLGQVIDVYSAGGDFHVFGPLRLTDIEDRSKVAPSQLLTDVSPQNEEVPYFESSDNAFSWSRVVDLIVPNSLEYSKLERSFNWADNAGSIDKEVGFETMGLIFKQRTDIGSDNAEWVPTDFTEIFDLAAIQIGTDPNTAQHNYGLKFKEGAIRSRDILDPLAIDNLIGVCYFRNPASNALGQVYRPTFNYGWNRSDTTLFTVTNNQVAFISGLKRNASTRNVTHVLVRAGRASGITASTSNENAIKAAEADANVYHEIIVPLSVSYTNSNAVAIKDARKNYVILTESGMEFVVQTNVNTAGILTVELSVGSVGQTLKGDEFISFHAMRCIGG